MNSDPVFVSVIIPVYNGESFLAEAIESIVRQNHAALEILVVDDGSTDGTRQVAARFKGAVRYAFQTNRGPPAARNAGLRLARGGVIGFLDADDLWSDDKLELQLTRFADCPYADVVLGYTQAMRASGIVEGQHRFEAFAEPWPALNLGSALFRRRAFDKVGLFDDSTIFCDDWDWFMRAREIGISMVIHQQVVRFYRRHDHNITRQTAQLNHHTLRILKKSLDRRRRQNGGQAQSLPKMIDYVR